MYGKTFIIQFEHYNAYFSELSFQNDNLKKPQSCKYS